MDPRIETNQDWRGMVLPPLPPWSGYSRPCPRVTPIKSIGRGGPLDFEALEECIGPGFRVLYEVEPKLRRRVLLARLQPPGEQVVIVSDIFNGHTPQFPQTVIKLPEVGLTTDFLGKILPCEARDLNFPVRSRYGRGGRSLHDLAQCLSARQVRVLWETDPDEFKHTARRLVVFCEACRHVWSALVCNLEGRSSRCPSCAASKASRIEEMCRRYLRLIFGDLVSEVPRRDLIVKLRYSFEGKEVFVRRPELDIVIERAVRNFRYIAIEVHGEQHYTRGWSGLSPERQIAKDRAKALACSEHGILLIEIPYTLFDDEIVAIAAALRDRFNQAVGEEMIGIAAHKKALEKWSIDDFGRITEIKVLQLRLQNRVEELNLKVLSPLSEVARTSSRLRLLCPNCKLERTLTASSVLQQSCLCRPCAKVVPVKSERMNFWKSVEVWCKKRNFRLLSRLDDYHGKSLKAAKFYFLDDKEQLRSVFCFTISRPVVENLRERSLVPIDQAPFHIVDRI